MMPSTQTHVLARGEGLERPVWEPGSTVTRFMLSDLGSILG